MSERRGGIPLSATASSSTGAGSWISVRGSLGYWGLQCSTENGSTGFTVALEGKIDATTNTTGVVTLVTCGATNNNVPQYSTLQYPRPVAFIRKNVTACTTGGGILPVAIGY